MPDTAAVIPRASGFAAGLQRYFSPDDAAPLFHFIAAQADKAAPVRRQEFSADDTPSELRRRASEASRRLAEVATSRILFTASEYHRALAPFGRRIFTTSKFTSPPA